LKVNKRFLYILIPVFVGIIVFDLLTKEFIAEAMMGEGNKSFISGLINFTYVENNGAAWNMFAGNRVFLIIISFVFVALLGFFYFLERKNGALFHIGAGLIFGGAIGNLVDRIFIGFVRDFIQFDFWKDFPVFNIADAALTIGVVLVVLYYVILLFKRGKNAGKNQDKQWRLWKKTWCFS